ncbi:MAG TPA: hypothetical protein PLX08_03060 [Bacteroidales bacterium]|nr:hypothetical protein [Bacteroidales bacterium]
MKLLIRILSFTVIAVMFSCEDSGLITNCSDCTIDEPEEANLIIKLTSTELPVTVRIFEGELDDSILYDIVSDFRGSEYRRNVILNKKYTVTAEYVINRNNYYAIDACIPRVKYTKDQCDDPCYFLYDRVLDLRLKYTAD